MIAGIDYGRVESYTVIVAVSDDLKTILGVERLRNLSHTETDERIARFMKRYNPDTVYAEDTGLNAVHNAHLESLGLNIKRVTLDKPTRSVLKNTIISDIMHGLITVTEQSITPEIYDVMVLIWAGKTPTSEGRKDTPANPAHPISE